MDKLTTITNSGRKKITLCPSSRVLAEGQDKRKKCLQSIEEPNYKLGILFPISYFGKREKGISPNPNPCPPRKRKSSRLLEKGQTNQKLDTAIENSAGGDAEFWGTANQSFPPLSIRQVRDASVESSELRQQFNSSHPMFDLPGDCLYHRRFWRYVRKCVPRTSY